jgi:hypothetical protein
VALFALAASAGLAAAAEPALATQTAPAALAAPATQTAPATLAAAAAAPADPAALVGATLGQAFAWFGPPDAVYAVRGPEAWQDDVVFVYPDRELYWFRDRVWQVRVDYAYGLRSGDAAGDAEVRLGEPLHRLPEALVYQLTGAAWPIRLRVGFDAAGRVDEIFVYRADF